MVNHKINVIYGNNIIYMIVYFQCTAVELPTEAQLANNVIYTIRAGKMIEVGIQLGLSQDEVEAIYIAV